MSFRCPAHPDRLATASCAICAARSCPDCAPVYAPLGEPVCPRCRAAAERVGARLASIPPSPRKSRLLPGLALAAALLGASAVALAPRPDPLDAATLFAVRAHVSTGAWPETLPPAAARAVHHRPASDDGPGLLWTEGPDGHDDGGRPLDLETARGDRIVLLPYNPAP